MVFEREHPIHRHHLISQSIHPERGTGRATIQLPEGTLAIFVAAPGKEARDRADVRSAEPGIDREAYTGLKRTARGALFRDLHRVPHIVSFHGRAHDGLRGIGRKLLR